LVSPYPKVPHYETIINLGILYLNQNRFQEAEFVFNKTKHFAKAKNDISLLGRTYFNLHVLESNMNRHQNASKFLDSASVIFTDMNWNYGIIRANLSRVSVYSNMGMNDKAELLAKELYKAIEKFNSPQLISEYYIVMHKIYESLGDIDKANHYFRLHFDKDEKLIGRKSLMALNEFELEKQKSAEKLKKLLLKTELDNHKRRTEILVLFIFASSVLVIFVFVFLRMKTRLHEQRILSENREIKHKLELRSREVLADSIKRLNLENLKEQVYTDLKATLSNLPKSQQELFSDLMSTLKRKNNEALIVEFEERFIGVHEDFFANLRNIAPNLSPTEVKLCAFIRLNLSTKEIAYLTNRTPGTIDNSRSKIRSKLNLREDDNLYAFLSQL
jgi:tetratricopeptide (TPR) repeat protein/DNA-binding CsgD family transcriptional regulator